MAEEKVPYFSFEGPAEEVSLAETVERAVEGDQEAFEVLYKRVLPLLQREVNKRFDRPEDREDALQETALRIYEKLGTLREPERFSGWALVVCSRVCSNMHRHKNSYDGLEDLRPETSTEETKGLDIIPADELLRDINPGARVDGTHVTEVVSRVLEELPVDQRDCLILWMERYSSAEIAEELGMNPSTVRSNIAYAKKKVGKSLKRMFREGTFDYRELSSDPVAAFLALLERFLARGRLVPVSGETGSPAMPGGMAALRRLARDPLTSIVAIVLVVALAIGVALALQTRSYVAPEAQNEPAAVVDQTVPVPTPEEPSEAAPGTAPGEENNPVNPAPPATPTPATPNAPGGGGGDAAPAQNPANNTALIRPDGRLTAFRAEDFGGITPNAVANAEQALTGGLTRLTNNYSGVPMTFQGLTDEEGLFAVDLFFGNYTGHKVRLEEMTDISVRDKDGNLIAKRASFVPDKTLILSPGEELTVKLPFPNSYITKEHLPPLSSDHYYDDAGVNVYGRPDYHIIDDIEEFAAKEIDELPPLTKPYPQNYPNQQNVLVYVRDMVEEGDEILCYMGLKNDTKATMTVDRFEYLRFYGVDDRTRAEGRVKFPKNFTLKPGEERYRLVAIPSSSYDNFSLLNSIGQNEDVIYDLDNGSI